MNNEVLETLGDLVRERKGIERKLSTTYSLGRDRAETHSKSLLPMYDGKSKSFSFQGAKKESVTIFHTLSNTSSEDSENEVDQIFYEDKESAVKAKAKGKAPIEVMSSSGEENYEDDSEECLSGSDSSSKGFAKPLFVEQSLDEPRGVKMHDEGNGKRSIRRRASSSTY